MTLCWGAGMHSHVKFSVGVWVYVSVHVWSTERWRSSRATAIIVAWVGWSQGGWLSWNRNRVCVCLHAT